MIKAVFLILSFLKVLQGYIISPHGLLDDIFPQTLELRRGCAGSTWGTNVGTHPASSPEPWAESRCHIQDDWQHV